MKTPEYIHLMNIEKDNIQWAEGKGGLKDEVTYTRNDIVVAIQAKAFKASSTLYDLKKENKELKEIISQLRSVIDESVGNAIVKALNKNI